MKCFKCEKRTGKHNIDKETCGACREVLKIDLVNIVLELDPIYLSESNRNKKVENPSWMLLNKVILDGHIKQMV